LKPRISIVIPTLNEAACLPETLKSLDGADNLEVIVVDGGSSDGTARLAMAAEASLVQVPAQRAHQLNQGAAVATGDIVLFLHADTQLPDGFDRHVRAALENPEIVAGAFQLHIDGAGRALRLIEWGTNARSRWRQLPYGDQALFLRTDTFRQLGGFREWPIMEDYEFAVRLRRAGRVVIVPAAVKTSARRWQELGPWKTTFTNQVIILAYRLGVSPKKLVSWY
jgi:rSAM/selenodomain-associated transferase 2